MGQETGCIFHRGKHIGLSQARELDGEEPKEVQHGQVQGPAAGEEQPHAPV